MLNLNNVDMTLNANNPEEEMKMINVNNMINGVVVDGLNKEEKMMIELNEKRELMMMAIEEELMQEIVDMVQVEEYEGLLAGIEWEIIQVLDKYEEDIELEELELDVLDEIQVGFYEQPIDYLIENEELLQEIDLLLSSIDTPVLKDLDKEVVVAAPNYKNLIAELNQSKAIIEATILSNIAKGFNNNSLLEKQIKEIEFEVTHLSGLLESTTFDERMYKMLLFKDFYNDNDLWEHYISNYYLPYMNKEVFNQLFSLDNLTKEKLKGIAKYSKKLIAKEEGIARLVALDGFNVSRNIYTLLYRKYSSQEESLKRDRYVVYNKYRELALLKGNAVLGQRMKGSDKNQDVVLWYLDGILVFSEPVKRIVNEFGLVAEPHFGWEENIDDYYIYPRYMTEETIHFNSGFNKLHKKQLEVRNALLSLGELVEQVNEKELDILSLVSLFDEGQEAYKSFKKNESYIQSSLKYRDASKSISLKTKEFYDSRERIQHSLLPYSVDLTASEYLARELSVNTKRYIQALVTLESGRASEGRVLIIDNEVIFFDRKSANGSYNQRIFLPKNVKSITRVNGSPIVGLT